MSAGKLDRMRAQRERQATELEQTADPESYYAERVKSALRRTAEGFIETGRWLIEAKSRIEHGRWRAWVDERLPISERTAQEFMQIAKSLGSKARDLAVLPPSRTTLLDLARLDDTAWRKVKPRVSPDLTRRELRSLTADSSGAERPAPPEPSAADEMARARIRLVAILGALPPGFYGELDAIVTELANLETRLREETGS